MPHEWPHRTWIDQSLHLLKDQITGSSLAIYATSNGRAWIWHRNDCEMQKLLWHHQPTNKNGEDALDSGFNVNCDWETQSGKGVCLLALLVSPWLLPGHHDLGSLHDLKADQHTATATSIRSCLVEVSSPSTFSATLLRRASPQSCPNFPPNGPSPSSLFL